MSPAVEARFERIEAILVRIANRQESEAEHIAMLLEDTKTRTRTSKD